MKVTSPLDAFAALSADRETLSIPVVDPTGSTQECVVDLVANVRAYNDRMSEERNGTS